MHRLTAYESYLLDEKAKYSEDEMLPAWLVLEKEAYSWIFRLSRRMDCSLQDAVVPTHLLAAIDKIPTIRFLKYRDISPALKEAITAIAAEVSLLKEDLQRPEMWKKPNLLSKNGLERWKITTKLVCDCVTISPDTEWRENWIKERELLNHTNKEEENRSSE